MKHNCIMISFFGQLKKELWPFAGGKGRTLARLYQAGFRIPNGFIILPRAFASDVLTREAWEQTQACLARLRRNSKDISFAVRSSALMEDSTQASFAGEFETILDVRKDDDIREAINTVRQSRHNARVQAYSSAQGIENQEQEIAVIIQCLIRADISGVLFTVDPVAGSLLHMTGNFIHGIGDKLVSGQINPLTFTFNRPGGTYNGPKELEKAAHVLYRKAVLLERSLGAPQDIEWAVANNRLYILQSRPITTLCGYNADTCEWNDSLTGRFLWCNTNLSEQAPEVRTPFSCSMYKILESEGPYSKAGRGLRVGGYPLTGIIGGRAYSNLSVLLTANRPMAGGDARKAAKMLSATYGEIPADIDIPLIPIPAWSWWTKVFPGMLGYLSAMNRFKKQIPRYVAENPLWCAGMHRCIRNADETKELAAIWQNEIKPYYLYSMILVFASAIDISPRLERRLRELVSSEDANALLSNLSGKSGDMESLGLVVGIGKVACGEMSREDFIKAYGHRGANEFEYAWPRPMEDPGWLDRQLAEHARNGTNVDALFMRKQAMFDAAWERFVLQYPKMAKAMKKRLAQAAQVARRREAVRSEAMRTLAVIRAFALQAGELTQIGEDIFFLTISEVYDVLVGNAGIIRLIPLRKATHEQYRALPQYPSIIIGRFDPFLWAADPNRRGVIYDVNASAKLHSLDAADTIKGFAGSMGVVEGTVRRVDRLEDGDEFQKGEVLVTSITNIGWTPLFPRAAAIITDIGAPLSHAAIVARELGVPAVVGCGNATMILKTGDRVRVDGGKGIVEILKRSKDVL